MSTRPQGRAFLFPVVWDREKACETAPTDISEPPPIADEELMDRLKTSDASALHLLFDRYSRLVLGIALRVLHDYGEAEEIVQDTYCYLYQKALLFDSSKGTAKGWIVQVAYHRALDRRAHLERRGFYLGTVIREQIAGCLELPKVRFADISVTSWLAPSFPSSYLPIKAAQANWRLQENRASDSWFQ